ncbi:MAG: hypothetical protein ACTSY1_02550 [Alphaproteobacteria bacterium]
MSEYFGLQKYFIIQSKYFCRYGESMEYNREIILEERLNKFISMNFDIPKSNFYRKMEFRKFLDLKSVLSDINNIVTMKVTIVFVEWLADCLGWSEEERDSALSDILSSKPNANGYDVEIEMGNESIIAEVKCNIPINGGDTYGAQQLTGILRDINSLVGGKSKSNMQPSDCLKFMVFVNIPEIREATRKLVDARRELSDTICLYIEGMELDNCEKVYVVFVDM